MQEIFENYIHSVKIQEEIDEIYRKIDASI